MNHEKRQRIFQRFAQQNPTPTTELIYHSPLELLIAVILSAQATDKAVNRATTGLFQLIKTPEDVLALGEAALKMQIKSIGLFNTKAANIIKTCQLLVSEHQSCVPNNRAALQALPGVGRKTANVVLNTLFHQGVIAVDTHIFRVANRTQLATGNTPLAVEKKLMQTVPTKYLANAHHWLVLHGRYVCTARKPHCQDCLIQDLCEWSHKTLKSPAKNSTNR